MVGEFKGNKITIDELAAITAKQFIRVDNRLSEVEERLDTKIDTEIGKLRAEMLIGFANLDRKIDLKADELRTELRNDMSVMLDDKLGIVIQKLDIVISVVQQHDVEIKQIKKDILVLKAA